MANETQEKGTAADAETLLSAGAPALATAYLAPVQYYAYLYASPEGAVEDVCEHYRKQTYRNRCYIATPQGPQPLTVPVERGDASHTAVRDIRLSEHGEWRRQHWTALVSAYERSPFFEYYADDFRPVYERGYKYLVDFNDALRAVTLSLLGLDRPVLRSERYLLPSELPSGTPDLRELVSPKAGAENDARFRPVPYYQVFSARTGFLPNLSIADLLFNMGPESRLVLRDSLH